MLVNSRAAQHGLVCPGSHRLLTGPCGSPVVVTVRRPRSRHPGTVGREGFRETDSAKQVRVLLPDRKMRRKTLKAPRRRLSENRMRDASRLTSGSRWQGMETRQGEGTEALSQETESNRSATPKSQAPSPDPTSRRAALRSARG